MKNKIFWASEAVLKKSFFVNHFETHDAVDRLYIATSGSSSRSLEQIKWVEQDFKRFEEICRAQAEFLSMGSSDIYLNVLPESHIAFLAAFHRARLAGAEFLNLALSGYKWCPENFAKVFKETRATIASLVPAQVFDILDRNIQAPKHFHRILVGGGKLSFSQVLKAKTLGWCLLGSYGSTELGAMNFANTYEDWQRDQFYFKPIQAVSYRLNESSLLEVSSPFLFTAYVYEDLQKKTTQRLEPKLNASFWTTEDFAKQHPEGIEILGRGSRFVKSLGENIDLDLLEEELRKSLKRDVAVLKLPNVRKSFELVVAIERREDLDVRKQLQSWNAMQAGPYRLSGLFLTRILRADNHKKLYSQMEEELNLNKKEIISL